MAHAILRHFQVRHLRPDLQPISQQFGDLANWIARSLPENDESREALRKLLEAKDCAVRAQLDGIADAAG